MKVFILREFDEYFATAATDSQVFLGVFTSREKVQIAIKERYPENTYTLTSNGSNQWFIEKAQSFVCEECDEEYENNKIYCKCGGKIVPYDYKIVGGIMIDEVEVDTLEEL